MPEACLPEGEFPLLLMLCYLTGERLGILATVKGIYELANRKVMPDSCWVTGHFKSIYPL